MCIANIYYLHGNYLVDELAVVGYFGFIFLCTLHAPGDMPPPPNQNVLREYSFQASLRKNRIRKIKPLITNTFRVRYIDFCGVYTAFFCRFHRLQIYIGKLERNQGRGRVQKSTPQEQRYFKGHEMDHKWPYFMPLRSFRSIEWDWGRRVQVRGGLGSWVEGRDLYLRLLPASHCVWHFYVPSPVTLPTACL